MSVMGRKSQKAIYMAFVLIWAICAVGFCKVSAAGPEKSQNYTFIETNLGGLGQDNSSSQDYQVQDSGGIIGVGTSADTSSQIEAGHETTSDPALSFAILTPDPTFGSFSPNSTATATAQFEVLDYTSYGYIVELFGTPPTNAEGYKISALGSDTSPQTGIEQYGINLVANTVPSSFGANPYYGQFGYGNAATNYNNPNEFRFVNGDTIADSTKSSGDTVYTISYIVNVSPLTPGGTYSAAQSLICVATY